MIAAESFFSTLISVSWCCYDSLLGDWENRFRLPKLLQEFTAGNLTYFRAAHSQLRMSLGLNCSNINFPSAAHGLREEMIIMKIGGLYCEEEELVWCEVTNGPILRFRFSGNFAYLDKELDVEISSSVHNLVQLVVIHKVEDSVCDCL